MQADMKTSRPPRSVRNWCDWGIRELKSCSDTAWLDTELLLAFVRGCERAELLFHESDVLSISQVDQFQKLIDQRAEGCPVAYLLGTQDFWSLTLHVAPGVLIPRPETEGVVEAALHMIRQSGFRNPDTPLRIVEFGTGSAAIPLALCSEVTDLRIVTVEKSAEALEIAKQNLHRHDSLLALRNNSITLLEGDGLEGLADEGEWDLLVSNPPYVAEGDDALAPGVRRFEPELALFAGADGLDCIRLLLKESVRLLRPEGRLLCELGAGQGEAVRALVPEILELEFELLHRDLQGHERILQVRRRAGSNDSAGTLRGLQI